VLGGSKKEIREPRTVSDLVSEEDGGGRHPLVESYPKERCANVEDYNKKGTLDSIYLA